MLTYCTVVQCGVATDWRSEASTSLLYNSLIYSFISPNEISDHTLPVRPHYRSARDRKIMHDLPRPVCPSSRCSALLATRLHAVHRGPIIGSFVVIVCLALRPCPRKLRMRSEQRCVPSRTGFPGRVSLGVRTLAFRPLRLSRPSSSTARRAPAAARRAGRRPSW